MRKFLSIAIITILALVSCKKELIPTENQNPATEQKVEALVTLNRVTSIGDAVFIKCSSLQNITLPTTIL